MPWCLMSSATMRLTESLIERFLGRKRLPSKHKQLQKQNQLS